MMKIALYIFNEMTDYEITLIMHLLRADAGMEVITCADTKEIIIAKSGLKYHVDLSISEIDADEIKGFIIPGGRYATLSPDLSILLHNLNENGKLIAGICGAGTMLLAKAGLLKQVKYTTPIVCWSNEYLTTYKMEDPFPRENYSSLKVVRDKNIITAIGTSFIQFSVEICDWFNLFKNEVEKDSFYKVMTGYEDCGGERI